ncbi:MAG TPA: CHASE2 domain-containing protein [Bryobacteraceae bacterium]|nr:CHASE2 domain-containing protein [Bryobacteraceae bacterium]
MPSKRTLGYAGVVAASLVIGFVSGSTSLAKQIDDSAYDWMFRLFPPPVTKPHCMILAIDDATYSAMGSQSEYRTMLATGLELLAAGHPRVVGIDMVLADQADPSKDARLERAMHATKNLVLVAHLVGQQWENPLPRFGQWAAAVGHDTADEHSNDGVTREIPLEQRMGRERRWALALEAFRLARGERILESPEDIQVGNQVIPAARTKEADRPLRVLYSQELTPEISIKQLKDHPEQAARFTGQTVFVGVTSDTATYDRVATPYGTGRIPGVEVHAQLFETLERGRFLVNASHLSLVEFCLLAGVLAGLIFVLLNGWPAYLSAGALLIAAHITPFLLFRQGIVFPYLAPMACAWLTVAAAASYQHFVVRRALRTSETERKRYQQAIHFVTHEMRTPLTAIQGSSELMGRYNLSEEKRKQMTDMINQESKRLARMIQTFLDVERLSDGQMELKREQFTAKELVEACLGRVRPLGERKNIRVSSGELAGVLEGDRELMEYAIYNLMTNAVKYSGPGTEVTVRCRIEGDRVRLSVQDQGIGMDAKELRQIFQKFYRTKRAEASGEKGTGIGLSIVEQIVQHHGGKMEVTSQPGKGSCFTVVLPARSRASQPNSVSV